MIHFKLLHPGLLVDHLGFIPAFFSEDDPRSAADQLDEAYAHGGGFMKHPNMDSWSIAPDGTLTYRDTEGGDDDEVYPPLAEAKLHNETLRVYDYAWLSIQQPDGTFAVSRVD